MVAFSMLSIMKTIIRPGRRFSKNKIYNTLLYENRDIDINLNAIINYVSYQKEIILYLLQLHKPIAKTVMSHCYFNAKCNLNKKPSEVTVLVYLCD